MSRSIIIINYYDIIMCLRDTDTFIDIDDCEDTMIISVVIIKCQLPLFFLFEYWSIYVVTCCHVDLQNMTLAIIWENNIF